MDENELEASYDRLLLDSEEDEDENQFNDTEGHDDLFVPLEDDSEDEMDVEEEDTEDVWDELIQKQDRWPFADASGINFDVVGGCKDPVDFYRLYVDDELINFVVDETNRYGNQKNPNWTLTTAFELKKLFALTMQMGIVKLPALRDYWSGDPVFGGHPICGDVMPRNRFENLLSNLHLADNVAADKSNRLYKIAEFMDKFNHKCQEVYRPGKDVCVDESLIPFRGRIVFRQYIPNKRHRYGIKVFKLCSRGGYTYKMSIYAGKQQQPRTGSVAEDVVMKLMEGLLDCGRVLYTDNWYTSIVLAKNLLQRRTNLVGTIRKNRRGLPKMVTGIKLKRGSLVARQNQNGIVVLKWKDKRDVLMLSTHHDHATDDAGKPFIVTDYNTGKSFVDVSDQMASYCPYIRKTTKWYLRIFFHVISQIAVVNAWSIHNMYYGTKMSLTDFKKCIVRSWLKLEAPETPTTKHKLEEVQGSKRVTRRRCAACYKTMSQNNGAVVARSPSKMVNKR
jgi:hypothetical protein